MSKLSYQDPNILLDEHFKSYTTKQLSKKMKLA